MRFKFSLFLLILVYFTLSLSAQINTDERVSFEGKTCILHQVQDGESISSICEEYGINQKILVAANSSLIFGLTPGNTIKIPVPEEAEFVEHKVKRKQTVFSIARQYEITLDELYRFNPAAKKGIESGQSLRIPVKNEDLFVETTESNTQEAENEPLSNKVNSTRLKYFYHQVEPGETLFELEKKFGISQDTLLAVNPNLISEILPGTIIQVPTILIPEIIPEPENETEFIRHRVQEGETIYDVATHFKVKISQLKKTNPELEYRDLIVGEELLIPDKSFRKKIFDETLGDSIWILPDYEITHSCNGMPEPCIADVQNHTKTYQVALMLPLFLDANDTINRISVSTKELLADSAFMSTYKRGTPLPKGTYKIRKDKIIDPRSENFMHLYEGVLMAADSLRKQGMKLELYVFDTNRDSSVVQSLVQQDIFREMDLIIGPVYPNLQGIVSAFSAKNRIPMVSPLSAAGNYENTNPYFFKVNPNKEYLMQETARLITERYFDKNFIVLQMGDYKHLPEASLVAQCRDRLFSTGYYDKSKEVLFHEYDFEAEGIWGIQRILSPVKENVFIIPAVNEGQISVAITNLNTLAEQADVHLVGLSGFKGYRSIQPEYFHQTQLQYLTHYFIDYESLPVNRFIGAFKKHFATEPNEFSFQGFDIAYYFMSALHMYGKEMVHCIPNFKMELTQLNLSFRKVSKTGGFMNYGLINVGYEKDFSIKNRGYYSPNCLIPIK